MNINEAIVATAKKQKECRRAFVKYLFLGVLFIAVLPVGGGFVVGHFLKIALHRYFSSLSTYLHPVFSCHAEDQIGGIYNGVKFSLSEAIDIPNDAKLNFGDSATLNLLSAIVFAWKKMKDIQAFSGSVLVCEFYKKFSGQTIVASRTLNTKFLGEKEQMDDTLFNDEFRVFMDDKVEARYLLTPAFMVRLRELKIKFAGDMGVSAAFMDDKFYLFLNGAKNRFETTLFSIPPSLYDAKQIKKKISELLSVFIYHRRVKFKP